MTDLLRAWAYPMLPEVRQAAAELGTTPSELLASAAHATVRARALARVEGALAGGIPPIEVVDGSEAMREVLSVPVARMLCVAVGERGLTTRYARAEGRLLGHRLKAEPDTGLVEDVAAQLGLPLEPGDGMPWRAHLGAYLQAAPNDPAWKLLLRPLARGYVPLDQTDVARLCEEQWTRRIESELLALDGRAIPAEDREAMAPLLAALQPRLETAKTEWETGDFGPVQPGLFPPCVKAIFEDLSRNANVPHHGRFAFATFLHTVGWNANQILDYLATTPNFNREKSRYQVEHVSGERGVSAYTPPGCATMQTNGVCPLDRRDGLCAKVKHPLSYYRAKLRFQKQDAPKPPPPDPPAPQLEAPA